jgi:hypothetical protein
VSVEMNESGGGGETVITQVEYERRRAFCDEMKIMTKPEFIEIARILRRHGVVISENRSGLFFDMSKISDEVFADLLQFREFVHQNSSELQKRDDIIDSLKPASD